ncbi:diguanylate cyclase domain-containing protein [Jeotgalibacillus proteolyticus]|uniref:diguanylate cyclase domain-containing protein n=1 Tax=Jeotgalibacillus proteolyticus TaxID=2082395 RepID=UPI003CEF1FE2
MRDVFIPLAVYMLPAFILFYMAVDVFWRNPKKVEHRLVSLSILCYGMLFLSEYVRHLLPIEYSPALVTYWFGNAGIMILSLFTHFIFKASLLYKKLPAFLYPSIFYLPLVPILLTYLFQENFMNSQEFVQVGMWKYPEFNTAYLVTLTVSNLFHLFVIFLLYYARTKARVAIQQKVLSLLIYAASFVLVWDVIFGYASFRGTIPPYPYIYGAFAWAVALSYALRKFDFLTSSHKRFETLYNLNPAAIVLIDRYGLIESANPAARLLLEEGQVNQLSFQHFIPVKRQKEWIQHLQHSFSKEEKFTNYETKIITASGAEKYVVMDGDFIFIDQHLHSMLIIRDIDSTKEDEKTIRFLAYHDSLTHLANRRSFYDQGEKAIREYQQLAVVLIDLDGFKGVNDTYGHQVGDAFLVHVAQLLKHSMKKSGLASRVGGDEFFLYMPLAYENEAEVYLDNLLAAFEQEPFLAENIDIPISVSIGVSLSPLHGNQLEALIHKADLAMYEIKHNGKNGYRIYNETMETKPLVL